MLLRAEGSSPHRARGDTGLGWCSPCCAARPRSDEPPGHRSVASALNASAPSPGASSHFPEKRSEVLQRTDPETTRVPVPGCPGMGTWKVAAGGTVWWVSPLGQQCPATPTALAQEELGDVCVPVTEKREYEPLAQSDELPLNSAERHLVKTSARSAAAAGEFLPLSWQVPPSLAVPSGHL